MANEEVGNANAVRIMNLLNEGEEKIAFGDYKKATIILGNTGSGKTTFTKFVSGHNENLYSQEVSEDSGEYLIIDDENKISVNSTVVSKTTFPELMVDEKTKNAYIDNPGFNDSRNEAFDIAASYFIKKELQSVKNVKLVLVINYPSLRKGVLRNEFTQLLQHFTKMLKNLDKYASGIALVATKVDNSYIKRGGQTNLVSDNKVLENIAEFLKEVRDNFKGMIEKGSKDVSNVRYEEEMKFYENSITLLDTILTNEKGTYTRLGIFRRPDMGGKLSEIPLMWENKKKLKNMLQHNLKYVRLDQDDVGYTISEKSKNVILDVVKELNKEVKSHMSAIGTNLIEFYKSEERNLYISDMYSVLEMFNKSLTTLSELKTTDYSIDGEKLIKDLFTKLRNSNHIVPETLLRKISKIGKFLTFLEDVSSKKFDSKTWKWVDELDSAHSYVENSILWYDLLQKIYPRLSEYERQTKIDDHVPNFNQVFRAEDETMLLENVPDFMKFIEQFNDNTDWLKSTNYPQMRKIRVDKAKLRYLNAIIESTLKEPVDQICAENRFTVIGEFIRLSEIIKHDCYLGSSSVQIFAKNAIFVDTDLVGEKDVAILARRWHIIGDRQINLNGDHGIDHYFSKAPSGSAPGNAGNDGKPGLPGHSAGNFFGIGQIVENVERLNITAVGGDGNNGQDGGDGQEGHNGSSYELHEDDWSNVYCGKERSCQFNVYYSKSSIFGLSVKGYVTYKFYGTEGGKGGDAGKGGAGGLGGKAGIIEFFTLSENNKSPVLVTGDGKVGIPGKSGLRGLGGENGVDQSFKLQFGTWFSRKLNQEGATLRIGTGPVGEVSNVLNYMGLQKPDHKTVQYSPSRLTSDYRNYLLKNFNNSIKQRATREFYLRLLNENNLKPTHTDEALMSEFSEMEKNYNSFQPNINTFLYDALLTRIVESAKNSGEISSLKSLYSAIRCKQIRLESAPENHLVGFSSYVNSFARFDEAEIDSFYDKMVTQKLKEIEDFLYFDLALPVDNLLAFQDENLSRLLNSSTFGDSELITTLSSWKTCNGFAKVEKLLRFIGYLVKLEFQTTSGINVEDVVFKEDDLSTTFVRPNTNVKSNMVNRLRELQLSNVISKKRDAMALILAKERRLLDSENLYYEQNVSLRDAEKLLEDVKYGSTDDKMSALEYVQQVHKNVHVFVENNLKRSKLSDVLGLIDLDQKLIELDAELSERFKNAKGDQLAKAVESLRSREEEFTASDNRIKDTAKTLEQLADLVVTDYSKETTTFGVINDPNVLTDLLEGLKTMTHGLDIDSEMYDDLIQIIQNIDFVCNALMRILDILPGYKERKIMNAYARYIEHLPTAPNNLKLSVQNDIAFYEYDRLLQAFQKYVFPLEEIKFVSPDLPSTPSYTNNLSDLRTSLSSNVDYLKKRIIAVESSTDDHVLEGDFSSNTIGGPFFTWKNSLHNKTLSRLLRGEKVALTATFPESSNLNMIKFGTIRPRFTLPPNQDEQKSQFEEVMRNFHMTMEHSGSSYFSFCRRIYLFDSDSSTRSHDFNTTDDTTNFVNDFIDDETSTWPLLDDYLEETMELEFQTENVQQFMQDSYSITPIEPASVGPTKYVLSPYTMWHFQLKPSDGNSTMFAMLDKFRKSELNLQLEGHARYISTTDENVCLQFEKSDHSSHISEINERTNRFWLEPKSNTITEFTNRKKRQIDDHENSGIFETWKNSYRSFTNNWISGPKHLSFESNDQSPSSTTLSFNFNATATLADFLARFFFKTKPYSTEQTPVNFTAIRHSVLCILDKFESILWGVCDRHNLHYEDLQFDPTRLMSDVEKEVINGTGVGYNLVNILLQSVSSNSILTENEKIRNDLEELVVNDLLSDGRQVHKPYASLCDDFIIENPPLYYEEYDYNNSSGGDSTIYRLHN